MSENILEEALKLTQGDRQDDYGPPQKHFDHLSKLVSAALKKDITAKELVIILMLLKVVRELNKPKRDNCVDIAGYAWVLNQVE